MRKIGNFFLGFCPLLFAIGAQYLSMALLLGVILLYILSTAVSGAFSPLLDLSQYLSDTNFSVCIMLCYAVICICFCGMWYYRSCGGTYAPRLRKTFHPYKLIGAVLLVPGMQFFSGCIIEVIYVVMPRWYEDYEALVENAGLDGDIGVPMLCYSVLLAPVCEELLFRGVTMRIYRRVFPFWMANLMQAALFGIFHMNWLQGIYAFVLGLVLGWVCECGGSIYHSIFLHVLFNLWGTVVTDRINRLIADISDTLLFSLVYLVVGIVSLCLGFYLYLRGIQEQKVC